jgi:hypothetical protein
MVTALATSSGSATRPSVPLVEAEADYYAVLNEVPLAA